MMGLKSSEEVRESFVCITIDTYVRSLLTGINNLLSGQEVPAYLVGGFVRDVLLHRHTGDIDIAVAADALEIARFTARKMGGSFVPLDEKNGVGRVVLADSTGVPGEGQWQVDFSTLTGSIREDLARRDFTINAMAIELNQAVTDSEAVKLADPFNGRKDLNHGIIRSVSGTAFQSDAIRLLRAARLAAELNFSIDPATEAQIRRHAGLIKGVAGERVREELLRLLAVDNSGRYLVYLDSLGLLTAVIPELETTRNIEQPKEHYWDIFQHSLKTVLAVDFLLREGAWDYDNGELLAAVPWSPELADFFRQEISSGSTRRSLLKLAALLHDVAKPQTKGIDTNGRMRFLGHASEGVRIVTDIMERLRFSNRETRLVETIVKHHLRPMQMSQDRLPTRRAVYRYFRDTGEAAVEILFHNLADHLATRGPHLIPAGWQEHIEIVEYIIEENSRQEKETLPVKLIDGHDLINIFGMKPGVQLGELLETVRERQAAGEITTRQEALEFVRQRLSTKG